MVWALSLSPFILIYLWCAVGFVLCPTGNLLEQLSYPVVYLVHLLLPLLDGPYTLELQDTVPSLVFGCPMFFMMSLKFIGPIVSTLLCHFSSSYIVFLDLVSNFLLSLKLSSISFLVSFSLISLVSQVRSFLGYVIRICKRLLLVLFCLVLPCLCRMIYDYSLVVLKVPCKLLLVLVIVCTCSMLYLGLVKVCTFLGFIRFLLLCFKTFISCLRIVGNYFSSLSISHVLFASVPLLSPSISAEEQHQPELDSPPVFSSYGLYLFCGVLMVGNFVQRLIPHMGRNRAIVAALDQATWGIPAFVGLTGFNFEGFFSYLIKTIKDYPGPYIIKEPKSSSDYQQHTGTQSFQNENSFSLLSVQNLISLMVLLISFLIWFYRSPPVSNQTVILTTSENYALNSIKVEEKSLLDGTLTMVDQKILGYPNLYATEAQKVFLLLESLEHKKNELAWFSEYLIQNPSHKTDYSACVKALKKNYPVTLSPSETTRNQLYELNQEGLSILEYNNKFDEIIAGSSISKEEQKYNYFKGLNHNVKLFTNNEVDTVENLKKSALKAEEKAKSLNLLDDTKASLNNLIMNPNRPDPSILNSRGRLSEEEYNRRKNMNLCLFCGGENHTIAGCTLKGKKGPVRSDRNRPQAEIKNSSSYPSLSIFIHGPNTHYLSGNHISALLDSGAQANFLCYELALKLGLKAIPRSPGRLANGKLFELWDVGEVTFYS